MKALIALFILSTAISTGCCRHSCNQCIPINPGTPRDLYYQDYYQTPQPGCHI